MERLTLRPEVEAFAQLMERKLQDNDHKGGWEDHDPLWLLDRLEQETVELEALIVDRHSRSLRAEEIAAEAADIANFAMMLADVCGGLKAITTPPPPQGIEALIDDLIACVVDETRGEYWEESKRAQYAAGTAEAKTALLKALTPPPQGVRVPVIPPEAGEELGRLLSDLKITVNNPHCERNIMPVRRWLAALVEAVLRQSPQGTATVEVPIKVHRDHRTGRHWAYIEVLGQEFISDAANTPEHAIAKLRHYVNGGGTDG